eukprot:scaffold34718_cov18-Tisochrysis_lutea.AAC.1
MAALQHPPGSKATQALEPCLSALLQDLDLSNHGMRAVAASQHSPGSKAAQALKRRLFIGCQGLNFHWGGDIGLGRTQQYAARVGWTRLATSYARNSWQGSQAVPAQSALRWPCNIEEDPTASSKNALVMTRCFQCHSASCATGVKVLTALANSCARGATVLTVLQVPKCSQCS